MFTTAFWKGAAERAVKTFLQTFVATATLSVGQDAIGVSAGILDIDWAGVISIAALATVLSLATSVGNADFTAGAPVGPARVDPADIPEEIEREPDEVEGVEDPELDEELSDAELEALREVDATPVPEDYEPRH